MLPSGALCWAGSYRNSVPLRDNSGRSASADAFERYDRQCFIIFDLKSVLRKSVRQQRHLYLQKNLRTCENCRGKAPWLIGCGFGDLVGVFEGRSSLCHCAFNTQIKFKLFYS